MGSAVRAHIDLQVRHGGPAPLSQYGTTIEQLAEVAVSARCNAADNPEAYYRDPITIDDVLSGPMIADPFTKLHCCIRSDGGAAVVMVNADRVKDLRSQPVWVLGAAETTSHMLTSQWDDMTVGPAAVERTTRIRPGRSVAGRGRRGPLYGAFTYMPLLTLEDLGFCPKGEGGAFVETGALRIGGQLPTNTDGGGLSACHPGQRGLFLLVEAVRQLRGECGPRQVADAKIACVSGTGGWFCSSGTMILGNEEP